MNIIITGASSGIGYQTAKALSKNNNNIIIAIARNKGQLENLKSEAFHNNIHIISFDLSSDDYNPLLSQINSIFNLGENSKIDILINNAGFLVKKNFIETNLEDWNNTINVNILSIVKMVKGLYNNFNKKEGSHIINIASMGGIHGSRKFPGLSSYSASKAAVNSLTESMAVEFKNDNIHVNSICPGAVQTKMLEEAFPGFIASTKPELMGQYIADFAMYSGKLMNGRMVQVSLES